jgi:nitrilase
VIPPVVDREALAVATLDHRRVREERQNFDPAGHYARPDVTQLTVNRERQRTVIFTE